MFFQSSQQTSHATNVSFSGGQKVTSTVGCDWQISINFVSFLQSLFVVTVVLIDGNKNYAILC